MKQCARAKCVCTLANCCGCGGRIKNGLKHENPVFEKGLHSYIRCKPRNQRMQRHTTRCTGRKRNYSLAPSDCTVPGTTTALPIAAHRTNTVGHHNTRPLQTEVTGRKKTQYDLTTTPRHNPQCNACTGVICSPLLHWRRRRVPRRGVPHKEQQHPPHNKRQPAKDETRGRHHGQPHISLVNADANTAPSHCMPPWHYCTRGGSTQCKPPQHAATGGGHTPPAGSQRGAAYTVPAVEPCRRSDALQRLAHGSVQALTRVREQ